MTEDTYPVQLYVYDLSHGMAAQLSLAMTGKYFPAIYHTGIIVHGREYYFGQGILQAAPGQTHHGTPLEIIDLGRTAIDKETWQEMLLEMRQRYNASTYHLLNHNCNTFSNEVSELLTGTQIPSKIRSLPEEFLATPLGQMFRPQIDSAFSPNPSGPLQPARARKNRKPSAAALAGAQSETAAASRLLESVIAESTGADASSSREWSIAGKDKTADSGTSRQSEWTLERGLETFMGRQAIFEDERLSSSIRERFDKILAAGATPSSDLPKRILCLGLGSITAGAVPQVQFAFLLLLRDHLSEKLDGFCPVEAYDPVFGDNDKELLQALGVDVLDENKRGSHHLDETTLVYMPHVGRNLTEKLLRANWTREGLRRLVLCSNDIEVYVTNVPARKLRQESPCLASIAPLLAREELPVLPSDHPQSVAGALNDMAFQRFAPSQEVPMQFWELPEESKVDDGETL